MTLQWRVGGYWVTCRCGREICVTIVLAGSEVLCRCGAAVVVPSLSEFRRCIGKGAYETSTVDVITAMLQSGLDISQVITHRIHYTAFEEGFELMKSGNCGKVVMSWEE